VIEAEQFDLIFGGMVLRTGEGIILAGPHHEGLPFNRETVTRYADSLNTRSAARACLMLAWRHRQHLGIAS
jgi:hypothetical protein